MSEWRYDGDPRMLSGDLAQSISIETQAYLAKDVDCTLDLRCHVLQEYIVDHLEMVHVNLDGKVLPVFV